MRCVTESNQKTKYDSDSLGLEVPKSENIVPEMNYFSVHNFFLEDVSNIKNITPEYV